MEIEDIVLFYSSVSNACYPCIQFINNNNIPINIVRLDSKKTRDIVSNGKYFQIKIVPTMVVVYNDGNLQTFVGKDKIILWLSNLLKSQEQDNYSTVEEEYEEIPKPKKKKKNKPVHFQSESESDEEIEFFSETEQTSKKNSKKTSGLLTGNQASGNGGMSNLIKMAKQMEQERQKTLGYNEDDLPKNT